MKTLAHRNIPLTIIGGGIHGSSIALRLLRDMPTAAKHIAIVDRHPKPLTEWRNKTERQGMTFLRSPVVHHISPNPLGIVEFAEQHNRSNEFAPPYSQPSTELFWDYCKDAVTELMDQNIYYQFEVSNLHWNKGSGQYPFRLVSKDNIGFRSSAVVLAVGSDDCVYIPSEFIEWTCRFPGNIIHSSQFSLDSLKNTDGRKKFVIVGSGLTAGTLAKSISELGHQVVLIARKKLKTEQFDFPPIWLGPKALTNFANESDFLRRYHIIKENRGEGSITPDVMEILTDSTNIEIYPETIIRKILSVGENKLGQCLQVETTRGMINHVSDVILATGYRFNLRHYGFLEDLMKQYSIPLICGLPILDTDLQFCPITNLFGSGTVAQLQVGPASSNIAGANLAYERIREKLLARLPKNSI